MCRYFGMKSTFTALFTALPVIACQNSAILRSRHHLEIGVRFSTQNVRIIQQASRALDRWSEIADLAWHREDTDGCAIDIREGKFTAQIEIAEATAANGAITFGPVGDLSAQELFITAFHEIGHLLGLQHNPSPLSVMYWIDIRGDERLDRADMRALAAIHALRHGSECNRHNPCQVLSAAFETRDGRETEPRQIAMAPLQNASLRRRATRFAHSVLFSRFESFAMQHRTLPRFGMFRKSKRLGLASVVS